MRIDVHNHVIPERALALLRSRPAYGVTIEDGMWRGAYHAEFALARSFVDPDAKLAELGQNAIEGAVLSAAPPLFFYDRDRRDGSGDLRGRQRGAGRVPRDHPRSPVVA